MAELEQVGEAQARGVRAEPGPGGGEAGEVAVGGREERPARPASGRGRPPPRRRCRRPASVLRRCMAGSTSWPAGGVLRSSGKPATISRTQIGPRRQLLVQPAGLVDEAAAELAQRHDALADLVGDQHHRSPAAARARPAGGRPARRWSRPARRRLVTHKVRQSTSTARSGPPWPASASGRSSGSSTVIQALPRRADGPRSARPSRHPAPRRWRHRPGAARTPGRAPRRARSCRSGRHPRSA